MREKKMVFTDQINRNEVLAKTQDRYFTNDDYKVITVHVLL